MKYKVFKQAGDHLFLGSAPAAGRTISKGGARRTPPFGRGFGAAGTPQIDEFPSAPTLKTPERVGLQGPLIGLYGAKVVKF